MGVGVDIATRVAAGDDPENSADGRVELSARADVAVRAAGEPFSPLGAAIPTHAAATINPTTAAVPETPFVRIHPSDVARTSSVTHG
jgi:hypothetical protein